MRDVAITPNILILCFSRPALTTHTSLTHVSLCLSAECFPNWTGSPAKAGAPLRVSCCTPKARYGSWHIVGADCICQAKGRCRLGLQTAVSTGVQGETSHNTQGRG